MSFLQLYFGTSGRIGRRTLWLKGLIPIYALWNVASLIDFLARAGGVAVTIAVMITAWPAIALMVKRWHDRGKSGWHVFAALIPIIGSIWVLIEVGILAGREGANRFGDAPSDQRPLSSLAIAGLVMAGSMLVIWPCIYLVNPTTAPYVTPKIESIAVLPFDNLSGDPEYGQAGDEVADGLRNQLAQVSSLTILPQTAVMQHYEPFKKEDEIGRELNAGAVVGGSVIRTGEELLINTYLIEVSTNLLLWSDAYKSDLQEVPVILNEMAVAIDQIIRNR